MALFLIGEELKSRRLFATLEQVGFCDSMYEPHLDPLILKCMDLDNEDETIARYNEIMDKRSRKINEEEESIVKQAMKAYRELIMGKKK